MTATPDEHGIFTFLALWAAGGTLTSFGLLLRLATERARRERAEDRAAHADRRYRQHITQATDRGRA